MEAILYAREAFRSINRKFIYPTGPFCSFRRPVESQEYREASDRMFREGVFWLDWLFSRPRWMKLRGPETEDRRVLEIEE